jgi:SAM-dependent methyltransferase
VSGRELHEAAATGFARAAERYERGRPGYPDAALGWLAERLELREDKTVVDLAAGTGKLTRLLTRTGARVVAVEPVAEMRALIAPPAEALDGTAGAIPLADASADAVTVAQAFHWFDPVSALPEIHRVLAPDGHMVIIWNTREDEDPVNRAIKAIVEPYRGDTPTHRRQPWREALDASPLFGQVEERTFPNPHELDGETLVERVTSTSFIAALPHDELESVAARARALAAGGPVTLRQRTDVHVVRVAPC